MTVRTSGRATLLLVAAISAGCGDGALGPEPSENLPEVALPAPASGREVGTELEFFQPGMQWADNGQALFFTPNVGPPFGVHRLDVPTGSADVIVPGSVQVLHISDDRESLYYTLGLDSYAIYRLATAGGQPELLVPAARHVFAISQNGRWLAWTGAYVDSLYVRDLETDETSVVAAKGTPLSISPDGRHHVHTSERGLVMTTLASGVTTDLERPERRVLDVRWTPSGPEVLAAGLDFLEIVRPGAGAPTRLRTTAGFLRPAQAAWSPDGTRVVASLLGLCLTQCTSWLVLIDVDTGSETVLASARDHIGRARFTPDGRTIAVSTGSRLYVLPLPDA